MGMPHVGVLQAPGKTVDQSKADEGPGQSRQNKDRQRRKPQTFIVGSSAF